MTKPSAQFVLTFTKREIPSSTKMRNAKNND